jgi:hypothetical protein
VSNLNKTGSSSARLAESRKPGIIIKNLLDYKIEASDGDIGQAYSFLFDDRSWIIRYLVIDTINCREEKYWLHPTGSAILVGPMRKSLLM